MNLLPEYIDGAIKDGIVIRCHPFCSKNCTSKKCADHYAKIKVGANGIYACPHGLSTMVLSDDRGQRIFTSLKEKETYNHPKVNQLRPKDYTIGPKLEYEKLLSLAEISINIEREKSIAISSQNETNNLLHEIRKINAQIKNTCDLIDISEISNDELLTYIENIHVCSYLIYNRFQYYDSVVNPSLNQGSNYTGVIFQKFDKMRKLFKGYLRKNVWISLNTQSRFEYPIFPTFETLLFIILENAIKYSLNGNPVNVNFKEVFNNTLYVSISSLSPYCTPEELVKICDRGYRGDEAKKTTVSGQGLGLNFARNICEEHQIKLEFSSEYKTTINSVKYGTFVVTLTFKKSEN